MQEKIEHNTVLLLDEISIPYLPSDDFAKSVWTIAVKEYWPSPWRELLKSRLSDHFSQQKKELLSTRWQSLEDLYTRFARDDAEDIDEKYIGYRQKLLEPFAYIENSDVFLQQMNKFFNDLQHLKNIFADAEIQDVVSLSSWYGDGIEKWLWWFPFEDVFLCYDLVGASFTRDYVMRFHSMDSSDAIFKHYAWSYKKWIQSDNEQLAPETIIALDKDIDTKLILRDEAKQIRWDKLTMQLFSRYAATINPVELLYLAAQRAWILWKITDLDEILYTLSNGSTVYDVIYSLDPLDEDGFDKRLDTILKEELQELRFPNTTLSLDKFVWFIDNEKLVHILSYIKRQWWQNNIVWLNFYALENVTKVPDSIYDFWWVKYCSITNSSNFPVLDFSFERFPLLEEINISSNNLNTIPSQLFSCATLKVLKCSENAIYEIPPEINKLSNLSRLDCYNNGIISFPNISGLQLLHTLDLSWNEISSIDIWLWWLPMLSIVDVSRNKIWSLPDDLKQSKSIEVLRICWNALTEIPSLQDMNNLNILNISGNPWLQKCPELPIGIHHCMLDAHVHAPRNLSIVHTFPKDDSNDSYKEIRIVTTLYDLKENIQHNLVLLDKTTYSMIASYAPLLFIQLLEDSRKAYEWSESIFDKTVVWERKTMLAFLDTSTLCELLIRGKYEITAAFESTFYLILHAWLKKDPTMEQLNSKDSMALWTFFGTISQMSERYLWPHMISPKPEYIENILKKLSEDPLKEKMLESYSPSTVMEFFLPLLNILDNNTNASLLVKGYLTTMIPTLKSRYRSDSKNKYYNLTGLFFEQCELHGIVTWLSQKEKQQYTIPDMSGLNTFEVNQRGNHDPCLVRLCFDNDSDGAWSFHHRLFTLTGAIPTQEWWINKQKAEKNGIFYELESKEGIIYIAVYNQKKELVSHIIANHPSVKIDESKIHDFLHDKWVAKEYYDIVMDRGHAWGEKEGLWLIKEQTSMAFIASCGWYNHIAKVLDINPLIQYIGTNWTGDTSVNDAYFASIVSAIVHQKNINWEIWHPEAIYIGDDKTKDPSYYQSENKKYNEYVQSYQLPHKNIYIPFKQALDLLEKKKI